jgi:hypothetical protein
MPARLPLFVALSLLVALGGGFVALRLVVPSDGARLAPGELAYHLDAPDRDVVETPYTAQPGDLQPGDVVLAVGGHSGDALASALFSPGTLGPVHTAWRTGATLNYTVERGGRRLTVAVMLRPYPLLALLGDE